MSIKDKTGKVVDEYKSTDDEYLDMPMVVLTNEYSASASEILTSALKEFGAATVVGKNTYGKGIVQSVIPLGDGTATSSRHRSISHTTTTISTRRVLRLILKWIFQMIIPMRISRARMTASTRRVLRF